jgi:hypothetical protein
MGCCGQKRESLHVQTTPQAYQTPVRTNAPVRANVPVPARTVSETAQRAVAQAVTRVLRFLGSGAVSVRGRASGRIYAFAPGAALQAVDERDVPGLLATGAFATVAR